MLGAGRRLVAIGLALAALAAAAPASADPTLWDVVRDPRTRQAQRALNAVERMMTRAEQPIFDPALRRNFALAAIAMLELAGGKALPDPRLRFLLGKLLIRSSVEREAQARELLESALAEAPNSPLAAEGWFNLAIACAKLGDSKREHEAYTRALDVQWNADSRAIIYLNRAESSMVLGNLTAALADYREAVRLAQDAEALALAYFGLGIAQERSGDLPSALASMQRASSIRFPSPHAPLALDSEAVFFVPPYDKYYYKALTAMAQARYATDVGERKRAWEEAIMHWQAYLERAEPDATPWVPNARRHLARSEREARELAKRSPKLKRRAGASAR
jgi:tetratricopeptide (TPR) repeat protein